MSLVHTLFYSKQRFSSPFPRANALNNRDDGGYDGGNSISYGYHDDHKYIKNYHDNLPLIFLCALLGIFVLGVIGVGFSYWYNGHNKYYDDSTHDNHRSLTRRSIHEFRSTGNDAYVHLDNSFASNDNLKSHLSKRSAFKGSNRYGSNSNGGSNSGSNVNVGDTDSDSSATVGGDQINNEANPTNVNFALAINNDEDTLTSNPVNVAVPISLTFDG